MELCKSWTAVIGRWCGIDQGFLKGDPLACAMLGPGESRPRRRIVEVVMMLVLQDPACAAAESGLPAVHRTQRHVGHLTSRTAAVHTWPTQSRCTPRLNFMIYLDS